MLENALHQIGRKGFARVLPSNNKNSLLSALA